MISRDYSEYININLAISDEEYDDTLFSLYTCTIRSVTEDAQKCTSGHSRGIHNIGLDNKQLIQINGQSFLIKRTKCKGYTCN